MENVEIIIFDMDGLLVDTERVYRDGWLYATKKHGIDMPKEIINNWGGKGMKLINEELSKYTGNMERTQEVRSTREDFFIDQLNAGLVPLKPYAKEIITFASEHVTVGLASSSFEKRATRVLETLRLRNYIDIAVFGDSVENLKPYPDVYLEVLKRARIPAKHGLAVEDSITGVTAAKNASLSAIMVPDSSFEKPTAIPENVVKVGNDLHVVKEFLNKLHT